MKALILAAGLGSRLKHKTSDIPKALVEVLGKPIMAYQLEALECNGIRDVGIVLGYKSEKIRSFIQAEFAHLAITFFENDIFDASNSAYSFWQAREYIQDDSYIHLNCDIIFSKGLLKRIIDHPFENVLTVRAMTLTANMEQVCMNSEGQILKMDNQKFDSAIGKAYGVAKLSKSSHQFVLPVIENFHKRGDVNQNYYGILRQAIEAVPYYGCDASDELVREINTLEDHTIVEEYLSTHV